MWLSKYKQEQWAEAYSGGQQNDHKARTIQEWDYYFGFADSSYGELSTTSLICSAQGTNYLGA